MQNFAYRRATDPADAVARVASDPDAMFVAGATDVVYLLENDVFAPRRLVDVSRLDLGGITRDGDWMRIGATRRMGEVAADPGIRSLFPAVSEALLAAASGQLRNMATVGGNLLQRTRCDYFRMPGHRCNKRAPGSGCDALEGVNRIHAVLGTSRACIANYPGDLAVALAALDARVRTLGPRGERTIALADLHRLPGDTPRVETVLGHGELITAIELPVSDVARASRYLKLRERASFAFADVSVAAGLHVEGGRIREARLALGGLGSKPWRVPDAEALLIGAAPSPDLYARAGEAAVRGAEPRGHNAFKVELARCAVARALEMSEAWA